MPRTRSTMDEALRLAVLALRELSLYTSGESPEPEDVVIMREHARSALARIVASTFAGSYREAVQWARDTGVIYCSCDAPVMDVEHDAGCRRCGLPVDFTPRA